MLKQTYIHALLFVFVKLCLISQESFAQSSLTTRGDIGIPSLRISTSYATKQELTANRIIISANSVKVGSVCAHDRELDVILYVGGHYVPALAYHTTIKIAAGQTSGTSEVVCVYQDNFLATDIEVFEGGRNICLDQGLSILGFAHQNQAIRCLAIYPSEEKLDWRVSPPPAERDITVKEAKDLGVDWRHFLSFDYIVTSYRQFAGFPTELRRAISTYVLAGGLLILENTPDEQLVHIDRLITPHIEITEQDSRWSPWISKNIKLGRRRLHGGGSIWTSTDRFDSLDFMLQDSTRHFPVSNILKDGDEDGEWFWKNLVTGVGQTPVTLFLVIICLIVFMMGPVLFYVTRKLRQRTLLLFLVPTVSAAFSAFILFFNFIREGSETHGRVSSLQYYDANTKSGFVWSRQSYFSGKPPRQGLKFSKDALIWPNFITTQRLSAVRLRQSTQGHIYLREADQVLRGWLVPRAQQQLNVAHRFDDYRMPISIASESGETILLTNTSDSPLEVVLVRGKKGFFFAESLEPHQTSELVAVTIDDLNSTLIKWSREFTPTIPANINWNTKFFSRAGFADPIDDYLQKKFKINDLPEYGYLIVSRHELCAETPFPREVFANEQNLHLITGIYQW